MRHVHAARGAAITSLAIASLALGTSPASAAHDRRKDITVPRSFCTNSAHNMAIWLQTRFLGANRLRRSRSINRTMCGGSAATWVWVNPPPSKCGPCHEQPGRKPYLVCHYRLLVAASYYSLVIPRWTGVRTTRNLKLAPCAGDPF